MRYPAIGLSLALFATHALAQPDPQGAGEGDQSVLSEAAEQARNENPQGGPPPGPRFSFSTGASHLFSADIDDGGDVSRTNLLAEFAIDYPITRQTAVTFSVTADAAVYDFSNDAFMGIEPIEDAAAFGFNLSARHAFDEKLSLLTLIGVQFAGESGTIFDDSATYRGLAALSYQWLDWLRVGGGAIIVTRLEDDPLVIPIVLVQAQIAEDLTLGNTTGRPGLALRYQALDSLALSLEGSFDRAEYRLDDDNAAASSGIFRDRAFPITFRVEYTPTRNIVIDGFVSLLVARELELLDEDGDDITDSDVDPTIGVGIRATFRF